jgi:hypothetical protein
MTTPATEAGKRLLAATKLSGAFVSMVAAIEAEAREGYILEDDCAASQRHSWDKAIASLTPADPPALDAAFAEVEAALPEGWGLGIERSGFGYEVGAGKNEWVIWDGIGYDSLPEALRALAARLTAREETP